MSNLSVVEALLEMKDRLEAASDHAQKISDCFSDCAKLVDDVFKRMDQGITH